MVAANGSEDAHLRSFKLLGDEPSYRGSDPLGFDEISTQLAELIFGSRDRTPFTLGIQASWGAGKSSLMHRLSELLCAQDATVVWFNAWTAERGDALEGLIKSVLVELDPNVLRRVLRNKNLMTWLRLLVTVVASRFGVAKLVDELWERARIDPKTRNELRDRLDEAMREWLGRTDAPNRLVVVFIDDLDRCSPDAVFQIFEAVKLYLDVPGLAFVVAFDENVVSDAVLEQKRYSKSITSKMYLEKIVQIEYRIPGPDDPQIESLLDQYAQGSGTEDLLDPTARALIVHGEADNTRRVELRNPRRLKRFINSFVLEHQLDVDAVDLKPDVLIRTLILRTYFSDFANLYGEAGDPIEEFLHYLEVRDALLSGDPPSPEMAGFIREHGIAPGPEIGLAELEKNLPEGFPELARNEQFIALVKSLNEAPARADVRTKLEKSREAGPSDLAEGVGGPTEQDLPSLAGLSVIWVDDEPQNNLSILNVLKRAGAFVATAESAQAAEELLQRHDGYDLLISDIGRGLHREAGFDGLKRLRDEDLYNGPAIFFTNRVTPARREKAKELRAGITADTKELLEEIRAIAASASAKRAVS